MRSVPTPPPPPSPASLGAKLRLSEASADTLEQLTRQLRTSLADAQSLTAASQRFADLMFHTFSASLPLVRVYATVPMEKLSGAEHGFAAALAAAKGLSRRVHAQTPTLCLMGSRGASPLWNDRMNSKDHLAIPLADSAFVASVPMVASLLSELGVDLKWLDAPGSIFSRRLVGGFNGLFHVPDAHLATDAQGRNIIPAQSFVEAHGVKTVFGMGGAYLGGTMVAMIFFTRESLSRAEVTPYASLASVFKMATSALVGAGRLFA